METLSTRRLTGYTFDGVILLASFLILGSNKKELVAYPVNKLDDFCNEFNVGNLRINPNHK